MQPPKKPESCYLSSQTSSMRAPLELLLTMIVSPFTWRRQQVARAPGALQPTERHLDRRQRRADRGDHAGRHPSEGSGVRGRRHRLHHWLRCDDRGAAWNANSTCFLRRSLYPVSPGCPSMRGYVASVDDLFRRHFVGNRGSAAERLITEG